MHLAIQEKRTGVPRLAPSRFSCRLAQESSGPPVRTEGKQGQRTRSEKGEVESLPPPFTP